MTPDSPTDASTATAGQGVRPLLRAWRERRRVTRLELALRADSSARSHCR